MIRVLTPDGWGQVLQADSVRGRTSYFVKGASFEGWYDGLQVQADWAEQPDDVIPNEDNDTVLPYQSRPQGPGWDGTTSTIQPNIDPHLDVEGDSNSLDGEPTDESAVKADIEGLFEPHSRISRARHQYTAKTTDPILDVAELPEESPSDTGAPTEDLFDDSRPHFERESATYDRLVIEDDLAFLRFASDDDENPFAKGDDDDSGKDSGSDDDSDDDEDDDSDSSKDDPDNGADSNRSSDGKVAALALTTTADLHFLANLCTCAEALPLHSKSEHREIQREAFEERTAPQKSPESRGDLPGVDPQEVPTQAELDARIEEHQPYHQTPLVLVDHSKDAEDGADSYNQPYDGKTEADKWNHEGDTRKLTSSVKKQADGYDKYIGGSDGHYYLIASGNGKLPKGEHYGHYETYEDAHAAVEAIIARNHAHASTKTAAPAQPAQPTQIESQIEQLMQFWAVDNNGWWHWTGSQGDLALLNQMQQQMQMVGMPQGQPGAMQAQSAVIKYASFAVEANVPVEWRSYLRLIASDRLVALAAWKDVVDKSKRLRAEGAIDVEAFRPDVITAYVQGDHGRYYTTVQRLGGVPGGKQLTSGQVSGWSCDCDWGQWAWLRKRSFVGRMCSHAYGLFLEMRSLDAKARKNKGKPIKSAAVNNKAAWTRNAQGAFEWVSDDPMKPTAMVAKTGSTWTATAWSDGTAEDSLVLGRFRNSEHARRAVARLIVAHIKLADDGDVDLVGGDDDEDDYTAPSSIPGGMAGNDQRNDADSGIQNSSSTLAVFAEHDDGDDDEGPESHDDGIQEDDHDDDESVDEEVARDEAGEGDNDDSDGFADSDDVDSDDDRLDNQYGKDADDDGGHDEPHKRDDDDDEGTDNPGDESDDDHVEKTSSVADLQKQYGLAHLAGANYSPKRQADLVREGEGGPGARNKTELRLADSQYEASSGQSPEDTLAFLF